MMKKKNLIVFGTRPGAIKEVVIKHIDVQIIYPVHFNPDVKKTYLQNIIRK